MHLCNEEDMKQLHAVKAFNREFGPGPIIAPTPSTDVGPLTLPAYDLYSKSDDPPKVNELKPYYQNLISKFFPDVIEW
jgi:inositol oxygenase